jgi:apolipoprotein N-acyltransferase
VSSRKLLFATAAGTATALLSYFGTGLHPIWPLLWFAPVPVLAIGPRLTATRAFLLAFVAWFAGETNLWLHLAQGIGLPVPLILLSFVLGAIVFGLGVLLVRSFLRRGAIFLAALAFPIYWVAFEYLTELASPHSTYGNLAYTQMDCLPLIQIAAITGIWGISFIVFLFGGAVATLLSGVGLPRQRRALAITVGAIVCAAVLFGEWRLRTNPNMQPVSVTLIAKDVPMSVYLGSEEQTLELLRQYADEVRRITPPATDVVVLPEKIGRVSEQALPEVDALFCSAASAVHAAIDLGLVRRLSSGAFNSSRFYSAEGKLEANYDKHHLLPGVEPESPGAKRVVVDETSGRWGLQICKDMDFPQLSREYAGDGVNLLLIPAWDFDLDRWLHARMAVLRGVENGFALARAARNGLLTLSDNRGRILAETATLPDRFASISGKVNVAREKTIYTKTGDWFAWLCVGSLIALLVALFRKRNTS